MADVNLRNLARMTVTSSGTGTITLNTAVTGFLTFDLAGCSTAAAGSVVRYAIADTTKSEIAYGTYTSSSLTLTRGSSTTGMKSTNADSPIDMSNAAQVFITDSRADHPFVVDTTGSPATMALSQNAETTATVSNTNAGALAIASVKTTSNAGTVSLRAASAAGGSVGGQEWTGSGSFFIDATNATGNLIFRTGAAPTQALTISSTQGVAALGTLSVTGGTTLSAALTYGGVTLANAVTGTGNMVLSASPTFTGTVGAAAITATGALSGASAAGTMVATQADQETSTSTTTLVSPGRQQFHPSAAKFWARWDITGALQAAYNTTSVTDNGVGDWTVNVATDFSSVFWAPFVAGGYIAGVSTMIYVIIDVTAGTVRIQAVRADTLVLADPDTPGSIFASGFGDQ